MKPIRKCAILFTLAVCSSAWAQSPQPVCDRGLGHFEETYLTGVTVRVVPVKNGGFATRACQAALRWGTEQTIVVPTAAQVDIDVLGADLGFGVPVIAFIVQPTQDDTRKNYEIWSLDKKPRKLFTLTGENSYRAVDADFNGQVAIWTTDAVAMLRFNSLTDPHGLSLPIVSPPVVVLKSEHGRLIDVSAWYRPQYDRQIAALRLHLTAGDVADFRSSDGHLNSISLPSTRSTRLRKTRSTVLEIVCAYLYSGRPERAWAELDAAWPAADVSRIKAAILTARAQGIETQVTRVASTTLPPKWLDSPKLYQYLNPSGQPDQDGGRLVYGAPGVSGTEGPVLVKDQQSLPLYAADKAPQAISLWRPPPSPQEQSLAQQDETVLLLIDAAGKVQSARMLAPANDPELLQAATGWKFIPASVDAKPVAYQLKMDVRLLR
jgi:hypothetical protein